MIRMPPTIAPALASALAGVWTFALAGCCADAPIRRHPGSNPELPFSQAVEVGRTVYLAGHLGLDPASGTPPADPADEAERMLDAFGATLDRVGAGFGDLVQVQVFCSDVALYDVFNRAYAARFDGEFPARAFVGSGPLLRGARFEMLGIAVR